MSFRNIAGAIFGVICGHGMMYAFLHGAIYLGCVFVAALLAGIALFIAGVLYEPDIRVLW